MRIRTSTTRVFLTDQRGGIAIIFALSIVALGMASGLAIDYSRSLSAYASLQQDLDSTLLYLGRTKLQSAEAEFDAQQAGSKYIQGLRRQKHDSGDLELTVSTPSPGKLVARASLSVPTSFSKLFGIKTMPVDVGAEVALGDQSVEVSLVLDNTGSMVGSKLAALKSAAKSLIEIAYEPERAAQNVKIGVVPFAQYVNVGQSNRNKSWMSVPLDTTQTGVKVCYMDTPVVGQSNCRTQTATAANDGVPYTYTYQACDYQYGTPVEKCYTPTTTNTWNGCAGSRNYPLETLDEQYDVPVPGVMNASCPSEIAPLTNDRSTLEDQIDGMVATGDTYIPGGLIWGWRLLSKEAPYSEANGYDERIYGQKVRKLLVLMSDGKNTLSPVYPAHTGNDAVLADELTLEVCSNIKAKGILIYSVAFQVADEGARTVLQKCASGPSKYFDADDEQQLEISFEEIARDFSPLRLTR